MGVESRSRNRPPHPNMYKQTSWPFATTGARHYHRHVQSHRAASSPPVPSQVLAFRILLKPSRCIMSATEAETTVVTVPRKKEKKLKPARKQVKPGDVEKKEAPQTGKEYSTPFLCEMLPTSTYTTKDIWYNKWAGGDREDSYSKCVLS